MYLFFFSGFFQIVFDISIIFPQSFLDLEYAILEVGAKEEPTKPPREELDITRWKKIKIKKTKRRNKKLKEMIAAELLARNDTVTESKTELPSLPEEVNDEPLIKNDILPTFPDTPPMNLDHVPCSQHIDSLAWSYVNNAWSIDNAITNCFANRVFRQNSKFPWFEPERKIWKSVRDLYNNFLALIIEWRHPIQTNKSSFYVEVVTARFSWRCLSFSSMNLYGSLYLCFRPLFRKHIYCHR